MPTKPDTVDAYIAGFPDAVRPVLVAIRAAIRKVLPEAAEAISYGIPTFKVNGRNLVHFAGWKTHVSVYPLPAGDAAFQDQLAPHRAGRGTAKFPLDKPVPYDFIARIAALLKEERVRGEGGPAAPASPAR